MYRKYGADAPMGCAGRPSDSDRQQGAERHSRDNIPCVISVQADDLVHLRINFRLGGQRSIGDIRTMAKRKSYTERWHRRRARLVKHSFHRGGLYYTGRETGVRDSGLLVKLAEKKKRWP